MKKRSESNMVRRRTVLAGAASISTLGIAFPGAAKANSREATDNIVEGVPDREIYDGLHEVRKEERRNDAVAEDSEYLDQFADEYGLKYTRTIAEPELTDEFVESQSNDGVSPQYSYVSDSDLDVIGLGHGDFPNRVTISAVMWFDEGTTFTARKPWHVEDAIGATFNSDQWAGVGIPELWSDEHDASWYSGSPGSDCVAGEVDINHSWYTLPEPAPVALNVPVEHTGGPLSTLWAHYDHTIADGSYPNSMSISASVGVFGVSVSPWPAVTKWSKGVPIDPSTVI